LSRRLPALFVGHGSPMNAIEDNPWSRAFLALAREVPRPKAILCVSAHWFVPGTFVTSGAHPATIHDFGGFPEELYRVRYPAPGSDTLAARVTQLTGATPSAEWGFDHGSWSVMRHLFPQADVPMVQLSIDYRLRPHEHVEIGKKLAALRDEGVLVVGSGNVTHNLRYAMTRRDQPQWSIDFDAAAAQACSRHDADALAKLIASDAGRLAHPTPDHFHPLLYVAGAASATDAVTFPIEGFDMGSLSMRSILFS
jgi:4,5-DOPA dioxygenase extradiol